MYITLILSVFAIGFMILSFIFFNAYHKLKDEKNSIIEEIIQKFETEKRNIINLYEQKLKNNYKICIINNDDTKETIDEKDKITDLEKDKLLYIEQVNSLLNIFTKQLEWANDNKEKSHVKFDDLLEILLEQNENIIDKVSNINYKKETTKIIREIDNYLFNKRYETTRLNADNEYIPDAINMGQYIRDKDCTEIFSNR